MWDLGKRGETFSVFLCLRPPESRGQDPVPPVEPPAAPPLGPHLNNRRVTSSGTRMRTMFDTETEESKEGERGEGKKDEE